MASVPQLDSLMSFVPKPNSIGLRIFTQVTFSHLLPAHKQKWHPPKWKLIFIKRAPGWSWLDNFVRGRE